MSRKTYFFNPHAISNLRPQSAEAPNPWIEGPTFSKNQGGVYFMGRVDIQNI